MDGHTEWTKRLKRLGWEAMKLKAFMSSSENRSKDELFISFYLKKQTNRKDNSTCECIQTVDIGAYISCKSFCRYCYANFDENKVNENSKLHNDDSSLLVGEIKSSDIIKERLN